MSKLKTTDVKAGGEGIPKTLQPGNCSCKINGVSLEEFTFKEGAYNLVLEMEGVDMGPEFEGFLVDKDNPESERYKGQVGSVKASEWAYVDGETKSGVPVSRDKEILKFIKSLCLALGPVGEKWWSSQDQKHDTIEQFVEAFNLDKPFKGIYLDYCLAGKEYQNKKGYSNYELFLPKFSKLGAPFGKKDKVKIAEFSTTTHIRKKKVEPVKEFGETTTESASGAPFSL